MRWLKSRGPWKRKNRIVKASGHLVEMLETRALLNATVTTPINSVAGAPGTTSAAIDLSQHFNDPLVPGTLVDVTTPEGTIPIALTDSKTPKTVANFLSYITNGEYQGTIIHRVAQGFVVQGGGYTPDGTHITQQAAVASEAGASNVTGTIAMALSTGPNSGTSEWFINLANNSSTLDGSNDGGPFTVFGNVVYNGMTVVNNIAALSIIDGSSTNSAWNTLPVQNSSAGVTASNLVTNSYQTVSPLTYTATSDDPSIATPNVSGSSLTVQFGSISGNTQIHVTATDAGGNTTTSTVAVGVGVATVTVGTKGVQVLRFREADGTVGNVALSGGKGTAAVTMLGGNLVQLPGKNQVVEVRGTTSSISIAVTGTTPTSVLSIWGQGHSGVVNVTGITNDAAMALLDAPLVSLNGNLTETGAIGRIILGKASNGTITIGAGSVANLDVTTMNNEQVNSFIPIDTLQTDTWTGTGGISATSLNDIRIKHSFGGTVSATRVQRFRAGSLVGGNWNVTGVVQNVSTAAISNLTLSSVNIQNLRVQGAISASMFSTSDNIGAIKAAALASTNIYAGAANLTSGLPASSTDFTTQQKIGTLRVKRFTNSDVAAQRIDSLELGSVQVSNNGTAFGVGTQRIKDLSLSVGKKRVHLHNVTTSAKVTGAFTKNNITPQDFEINIL